MSHRVVILPIEMADRSRKVIGWYPDEDADGGGDWFASIFRSERPPLISGFDFEGIRAHWGAICLDYKDPTHFFYPPDFEK